MPCGLNNLKEGVQEPPSTGRLGRDLSDIARHGRQETFLLKFRQILNKRNKTTTYAFRLIKSRLQRRKLTQSTSHTIPEITFLF